MTTLQERDIEIEIPDALSGRKFDDRTHGLSHCMKAVDFIVELTDRILFIEIKDPPDLASLPPNAKDDYVEKFLSGEEDADFYRKYRDSFLYEWAAKRVEKPIYYLILVAFERLTKAELVARTEALKHKLPVADAVPETARLARFLRRRMHCVQPRGLEPGVSGISRPAYFSIGPEAISALVSSETVAATSKKKEELIWISSSCAGCASRLSSASTTGRRRSGRQSFWIWR